jgi:hypothetical protein
LRNARRSRDPLGGPKRGSYILFLETSEADFRANRRLYNDWYRSLTLY